jgi:hypothetical protein
MKTTIDMAREVYGAHTEWTGAPLDRLEQLVALARADEREETDRLRALCDELLSELYVYRASKYLKDTTEALRARNKQ